MCTPGAQLLPNRYGAVLGGYHPRPKVHDKEMARMPLLMYTTTHPPSKCTLLAYMQAPLVHNNNNIYNNVHPLELVITW